MASTSFRWTCGVVPLLLTVAIACGSSESSSGSSNTSSKDDGGEKGDAKSPGQADASPSDGAKVGNLIGNGTFDSGTSGWLSSPSLPKWVNDDGMPAGSISVTSITGGNSPGIASVHTCVHLGATDAALKISLDVRSIGQVGACRFAIDASADDNCSSLKFPEDIGDAAFDVGETWQHREETMVRRTGGGFGPITTIQFTISCRAQASSVPYEVRFDNISLSP